MITSLTVHTIYVEGDDDLAVLSRWFPVTQFKKAGGKDEVRRRVENSAADCGVLDRDFATDAQVLASCTTAGRTVILSRYCIENYLLEPDIIAAACAALNLADEHPAHIWLDETHIRRTLHEWGDTLTLYAAANAIVSQWRERITLDRELGFLRYFGPLPPVTREEVLDSLRRRLAALTPIRKIESLLDDNYRQIITDVQTWTGLHRWINGKILLEDYLYPQAFAQIGLSKARVRDLLIEAGRTRIPAELRELSRRW
jgi:hypothetical protein